MEDEPVYGEGVNEGVNEGAENAKESPKKPSRFNGKEDGVCFTSENQPDPKLKSEGWKKKRAEKLLTQMILAKMLKGNTLEHYVESLVDNAVKGNPKAIDTINNGIEEHVVKQEITTNTPTIILPPQPTDE